MSTDAGERHALELAARAALWPLVVEGLNEAVWLVDPVELRVVAINEIALALFGVRREVVLHAPAASLLATPEDLAYWNDVAAGRAGDLLSPTLLVRADGSMRHVVRRITALPGPRGLAPFMVALQDETARRRADDERETLLAELRATLESTADGILVTDAGGRIRAFNRRFADLWALPEALLHARDDAAVHEWLRSSVLDASGYDRRLAQIAADAEHRASDRLLLHSGKVLDRVTQPQRSFGRAIGRVWAFRDVSELVAAGHRIDALSFTDLLTGLPNRRHLADRVAHAIALSRREGGGFALAVLDLDRFKPINDGLGHDVGDQVLHQVAARVKACLREVDLVARIGGDQFALLLHGVDARGAEMTARRVLDAIARPFVFGGTPFSLTCSIGIALCPGDSSNADALVCHAETAMQRAKEGGRAGLRFHRADNEVDQRSRMRLDHAMRQALAAGDFRLHYQPQVDVADGRPVGAEALLRWHDPELGAVSPAEFIPVAEDSGFIVPIGDWVLAEAVRQAAAWRDEGLDVPVSVNVSALQFEQADFVERIESALDASGLPASRLELELTERILVRDADEALARLTRLANLGVRLSIDDFGTGYSSLAYLKRFPIDKLKIDRGFVRGLPQDDSDAGIVRAIVEMARALGLTVVAEGVETEAQREFLQAAGCAEYQGFLCAPALEPQALGRLLRERRTPA